MCRGDLGFEMAMVKPADGDGYECDDDSDRDGRRYAQGLQFVEERVPEYFFGDVAAKHCKTRPSWVQPARFRETDSERNAACGVETEGGQDDDIGELFRNGA